MDLRKLGYFLAVIDEGTFTRAAAAQYVSQPGLSQGIRELEAELKMSLFDRIGRSVHLTDAGRALEGPARQVLRGVQSAQSAVAGVAGLLTGRIDLGCLPTLASDPTAGLIGRFRRLHPGLQVILADISDPQDLQAKLRAGVIEVAITEAERLDGDVIVPMESTGDLVRHRLAEQRMVVVGPPGSDGAQSWEQLADLDFIATKRGSSLRQLLDDAFKNLERPPRVVVETAQREAIVPLVLAGAGSALIPEASAVLAVSLGAVRSDPEPAQTRSVIVIHRAGVLSPASKRFVELALDTVSNHDRRTYGDALETV
jgi:LysR family transcriptional regulator, carnitine catabolism transcriptional activator